MKTLGFYMLFQLKNNLLNAKNDIMFSVFMLNGLGTMIYLLLCHAQGVD